MHCAAALPDELHDLSNRSESEAVESPATICIEIHRLGRRCGVRATSAFERWRKPILLVRTGIGYWRANTGISGEDGQDDTRWCRASALSVSRTWMNQTSHLLFSSKILRLRRFVSLSSQSATLQGVPRLSSGGWSL
eukprot:scaffold564_cov248-Pinguiococcus_pyrenoidosus.AAC.24